MQWRLPNVQVSTEEAVSFFTKAQVPLDYLQQIVKVSADADPYSVP